MAVAKRETGKYRTTFVKEIYVNSGDVEKELNQWLEENEEKVEVVDLKISSCYFRDLQTKTIVVIFYRKKTAPKKLYFDMDNVLVDFKSGLNQVPD